MRLTLQDSFNFDSESSVLCQFKLNSSYYCELNVTNVNYILKVILENKWRVIIYSFVFIEATLIIVTAFWIHLVHTSK